MKKRRIVHIISSLKRGGAESLLVDLVRSLQHDEQQVLYFHDGPNRLAIEAMGVKTYQIKGLLCLYDLLFFIRLCTILTRFKPDIIHSGLWAANLAARLYATMFRCAHVSVVHLEIEQDGKVRNLLDTLTFSWSQEVIAVSHQVGESIASKQWIPAQRIHVVPNGIDPVIVRSQVKGSVQRDTLGIPPHAWVVGSVGRFIARKNYSLLLHAFSHMRAVRLDAYLVLVGFGPLEAQLRELIKHLHIEPYVKVVVGKPAYEYYPLFDCFVLSSLKEGISIALLEAMSFELPCVVTHDQPSHEVVQDGINGIVVLQPDSRTLSQALLDLSQDPANAVRLGYNAYQTIRDRFSFEGMAHSYSDIFDRAIATRRREIREPK